MDWSQNEASLIVTDYFSMLVDELTGLPFNKSHHRRLLAPLLQQRSDSSIENKHSNISAVMTKLGLPYIKGYKPRFHYQKILETSVIDYVRSNKAILEPLFKRFADSVVEISKAPDFTNMIEEAPTSQVVNEPDIGYERKPIKTNYLEREQKNAVTGIRGEQLVIDYERWRLMEAGKENLANRIKWISKDDDGAGYDILSKDIDGTDRFIEVKTTKLSKETPIYFSKNEYEFSQKNKRSYYLYRVYNLEKNPKIFKVKGSFDEFCKMEVISYKGYF